MTDPHNAPDIDDGDVGPPRPPAEDEDEEAEAGPMPPKAKKRKVSAVPQSHLHSVTLGVAAVGWARQGATNCVRIECHAAGVPACPPLQVLPFEQQYLEGLPCAQMYERSYMHRDTVTQVAVRGLWHLWQTCRQARSLLLSYHTSTQLAPVLELAERTGVTAGTPPPPLAPCRPPAPISSSRAARTGTSSFGRSRSGALSL